MPEEPKRSWLKSISWRVIATSTGMFLVYFFTGRLELTAGFGIGDVVLKLIFYFMHERAWDMTEYGRSLGGKVASSMRSPPVMSTYSDTVSSIVQKMVDSDIGAVIIADGDIPVGMVTERDIIGRVFKTFKDPTKTFARDVMSSPITIIEYDQTLTDALKVMREKHIRRLAVAQEGKVVGIVTQRRILSALTSAS